MFASLASMFPSVSGAAYFAGCMVAFGAVVIGGASVIAWAWRKWT